MRPDETVYTLTQRFDALGVASTEKRRRGLEQELAPIVVSETRMDGSRSIGHCDEVTSTLLQSVLNAVPSKESLWRSCWGLLTDGHGATGPMPWKLHGQIGRIPFAGAGASHDLGLGDDREGPMMLLWGSDAQSQTYGGNDDKRAV